MRTLPGLLLDKFDIHAVGLTTRKRRGEAAEAAFLAKASGLGFGVAKPWGDSERYDFLLDSGHGDFWRVQVKSTQRYAESRYRVKAVRLAQKPALLPPRRAQSALRKIPRGLVPDGLPSLRTDRTRANRTRLRQPEPSPRLLPLRATLRPLCRLPPLPPAHLIPSCHSESALAVRNLLFPPVVSGKRGAPRVSPLLRPGIPALI